MSVYYQYKMNVKIYIYESLFSKISNGLSSIYVRNNIELRLLQIVMQNQNVLFQEAIQILEIRSNMCENARQSTSVHQF